MFENLEINMCDFQFVRFKDMEQNGKSTIMFRKFGPEQRFGGSLQLDPAWDFQLIAKTMNYSEKQFEELGNQMQRVFIKVTNVKALEDLGNVPIHSVIKCSDEEWLVTSAIPIRRLSELRSLPFYRWASVLRFPSIEVITV